jgi:hypothetical protein
MKPMSARTLSSASSKINSSIENSLSESKSLNRLDKVDEIEESDESLKRDQTSFWVLGSLLGPCTEKYQRGDGIDIYIDCAMFLPDNCTVTRINLRLFTNEKQQVGPVYEGFSSSQSIAVSPNYKMKVILWF